MQQFTWKTNASNEINITSDLVDELLSHKPGEVSRLVLPSGETFCIMGLDDFNHILSLANMDPMSETKTR
jgi:hypothetical protein